MKCNGRASNLQVKPMSARKCCVAQSFNDRCVGVFKSSVFADETDRHLARQMIRPECKHNAATSTTFAHLLLSPTKYSTTVLKNKFKISTKTQTCVTPSTIALKHLLCVCVCQGLTRHPRQTDMDSTYKCCVVSRYISQGVLAHAPLMLALKVKGQDQMSVKYNTAAGHHNTYHYQVTSMRREFFFQVFV